VPRGGKRASAGRKKGSATKRTAAVKRESVANGISPADVLQAIMERYWKAKNWDKAREVANDLMPYRHPRLAAVEHTGKDGGPVEQTIIILPAKATHADD
jgi:hypothetical protein